MACGVNNVGDCCALHDGGDTLCFPVGKDVGIWAASRGEGLRSLAGHTSRVLCVTVEGDVLASGSNDKSIRLWSLGTGACTGVLEGHTDNVCGLSLRGDLLFSGSTDKSVRWWSMSRKACTATQKEHTNTVPSCKLGPSLAFSGARQKVKVWPFAAQHRDAGARQRCHQHRRAGGHPRRGLCRP